MPAMLDDGELYVACTYEVSRCGSGTLHNCVKIRGAPHRGRKIDMLSN